MAANTRGLRIMPPPNPLDPMLVVARQRRVSDNGDPANDHLRVDEEVVASPPGDEPYVVPEFLVKYGVFAA